MEIDVSIGEDSLSLNIQDHFRFSDSGEISRLIDFGSSLGVDMLNLDVDKLIPRMIRGVAGCEGGCPADAKSLVKEGFGNFQLSYIEGGILSAVCELNGGKSLNVKIFPEFG